MQGHDVLKYQLDALRPGPMQSRAHIHDIECHYSEPLRDKALAPAVQPRKQFNCQWLHIHLKWQYMATTPAPLTHQSRLDEILHAIVLAGITAANLFVKNESSREHAAEYINLVNGTLLPTVDALLNPPS